MQTELIISRFKITKIDESQLNRKVELYTKPIQSKHSYRRKKLIMIVVKLLACAECTSST